MYTGIENKVAVITGAAEGIGFEMANQLVDHGAKVVLNDINESLLSAAVQKLNQKKTGACFAFAGNAGDIDVIHGMVDLATEKFGGIDLVIANAGITLFGDFFDFTPENFSSVIDVNMKGAFFLTQYAAKYMKKQGVKGRILLMSSNVGVQAYPHLAAYSMTKAALQMLAKSLVLALSPHGITVNALAPGATLTERTKLEDPDYNKTWGELIPRGTAAIPEDIAKAGLFLLSDEGKHANGHTLVIDGGWVHTSPYPESIS